MTKHQSNCLAPICQDDCSDDLVWYAGEPICKKTPYTLWQKKQKIINDYLKKGNTLKCQEEPLNVRLLKERSF